LLQQQSSGLATRSPAPAGQPVGVIGIPNTGQTEKQKFRTPMRKKWNGPTNTGTVEKEISCRVFAFMNSSP
jgi:hypothetical protein